MAVSLDVDEDGAVTPRVIRMDGRAYPIDRVLDVRRASSLKVGGDGIRYTVRVGGRSTYLFDEDPRWFVEEKVREGT